MPNSNPFLSLENADLDANNNNPLLNAEDPAKAAEEAAETKPEDFEVIQPETIEVEDVKESDVIFEGDVEEKLKEIENVVKETTDTSDTLQALASVAQEMHNIIATNGKLSTAEMLIVQTAVNSCEAALPELNEVTIAMPSMEDFKTVGMQYTQSQVSLESVIDKLFTAVNNLELNIKRLFKNGLDLATSMTPIIDHQIKRIARIRGVLNNARRDDGQKEITAEFVTKLCIEGRAPDATTVVKTAAYLNQIMTETLSEKVNTSAIGYMKSVQGAISETMSDRELKSPSFILKFALTRLMRMTDFTAQYAEQVDAASDSTIAKQIRIDNKVSPELFTMFPSVAKIRDPNHDEDFVEARRSLSLFGNRAVTITQYKKEVKTDLRLHVTPELSLVNMGKGHVRNIQALNATQQVEVLDNALAILETSRTYFKAYAARNMACMNVWKESFRMVQQMKKDQSGMGRIVLRKACVELIDHYTRVYWTGIFKNQSTIALYGRKTATALVDLVEASSKTAQGGSPSQESLTLDVNPFLV